MTATVDTRIFNNAKNVLMQATRQSESLPNQVTSGEGADQVLSDWCCHFWQPLQPHLSLSTVSSSFLGLHSASEGTCASTPEPWRKRVSSVMNESWVKKTMLQQVCDLVSLWFCGCFLMQMVSWRDEPGCCWRHVEKDSLWWSLFSTSQRTRSVQLCNLIQVCVHIIHHTIWLSSPHLKRAWTFCSHAPADKVIGLYKQIFVNKIYFTESCKLYFV